MITYNLFMKHGHKKEDAKIVEKQLREELGPIFYFSEIREDGSIFYGTTTGMGIIKSREALLKDIKKIL